MYRILYRTTQYVIYAKSPYIIQKGPTAQKNLTDDDGNGLRSYDYNDGRMYKISHRTAQYVTYKHPIHHTEEPYRTKRDYSKITIMVLGNKIIMMV